MRTMRQFGGTLRIPALALVILLPAGLGAQSKVATTAAQFLSISVGPKAMAMGSAFVASKEDATLLYWNPGAFAQAGQSQVAFSHTDWLVGTKFRWFGGMFRVDDENAVGLSVTQLDYGEEEVTTVELPDGSGERWSANDLSIGLSYSRRLTDRFSMGGSVKYVNQQIWNESADAFAVDLGLLFVTSFNNMRLGVTMTNFGGDLKLEGRDLLVPADIDPANAGSNKDLSANLKTDPRPMPLTFRVGVAMDVFQGEEFIVTVAADALRPTDAETGLNVGTEVGWNRIIFLRGGYKSVVGGGANLGDRKDVQEGLTLGAGLRYAAEGIASIEVDYAYTQFGLFGNLNTIGLSVGF